MRASGYRKILDANPVPVAVVNGRLRAVYVNAAFGSLFPGGKPKGRIGEIFSCDEADGNCRKCMRSENCPYCTTFMDSIRENAEMTSPLSLRVPDNGAITDMLFTLKVTPMGGGLWTGTIEQRAAPGIDSDLEKAKALQKNFLPTGNWAGGKRYCFINDPYAAVGGDVVKVFEVNGSAFALIADVSGKGMSAALITAFLNGALEKDEPSPAESIRRLNRKFNDDVWDPSNYITVAAVRIDEDSITYSLAGLNAPILLKSDAAVTRIKADSFAVCHSWYNTDPQYFEDTVPYSPGNILVLMTDGITECRNAAGEEFGEDNVVRILSQSSSCEDFKARLIKGLEEFGSIPKDDLSAIAFSL